MNVMAKTGGEWLTIILECAVGLFVIGQLVSHGPMAQAFHFEPPTLKYRQSRYATKGKYSGSRFCS